MKRNKRRRDEHGKVRPGGEPKARPVLRITTSESGLGIDTLVEAFSPVAWGHALACAAMQLAGAAYEAKIMVLEAGAPRRAERHEILRTIVEGIRNSIGDLSNTGSYTQYSTGNETAVTPADFKVDELVTLLGVTASQIDLQVRCDAIADAVRLAKLGSFVVMLFDPKTPELVAHATNADHEETISALSAVQTEIVRKRRRESGDA